MHTYLHTHMHTHTCTHAHTHMHTYLHTHMHTHTYINAMLLSEQEGDTALHDAVRLNRQQIAKLLILSGAETHITNVVSNTHTAHTHTCTIHTHKQTNNTEHHAHTHTHPHTHAHTHTPTHAQTHPPICHFPTLLQNQFTDLVSHLHDQIVL